MKRRINAAAGLFLAAVMVLSLFAGTAYAVGGSKTREEVSLRYMSNWPSGPEDINCRSAILLEMNSGEVLFTKNEDEKRYPASITKVMTALLVIEKCDLNDTVTFSHAAVTDLEEGGYNGYYKEGEELTVEQCLYALLLDSVNECGYALAEHVAGSVDAFADMMNEKAASLGCTGTHFANPHGLNNENHYTTAHDMAKIFWACMQNPKFYEIDSATSYKIDPTEKNPEGFSMKMHHKMMQEDSDFYYEGVKAGKTGYTSIAKNTLLTYAEKDGVELLCVVMKGDGGGAVYNDTKKLLNYGFKNFTLMDLTANVTDYLNGLNFGNAMPLKAQGNSVFFVPNGTESISLSLEKKGAFDADGTVGNLVFACGEDKLTAIPVVIDREAMAAAQTSVPETEENGGSTAEAGATTEADGSDTAEATETEEAKTSEEEETGESIPSREESKSGGTFRTVLLIVLGVAVAAGVVWVLLRRAKVNRIRSQKRKEIVDRFRNNKSR